MPQYYFDVTQDRHHHSDEFGIFLSSHEDAQYEAVALSIALARESHPTDGRLTMTVDVRPEGEGTFFRVSFTSEKITIQGSPDVVAGERRRV